MVTATPRAKSSQDPWSLGLTLHTPSTATLAGCHQGTWHVVAACITYGAPPAEFRAAGDVGAGDGAPSTSCTCFLSGDSLLSLMAAIRIVISIMFRSARAKAMMCG